MPLHRTLGMLAKYVKLANLNAFVSSDWDRAIFKVGETAKRRRKGAAKSIFDGELVAVKDNICSVSEPTTCASKMLEGFVSPYTATVVKKLQAAGVIVLGKANLDEFGMGSHSTNSSFGTVKVPYQLKQSVGGSSGGSAAAVATGQCLAALGTDTGGSVRLPAAWTGIVGFKPSYGMLSRWGVVAYANSLDTVGILAHHVEVARQIYDLINGFDAHDPTSMPESTRSRIAACLQRRVRPRSLRVGVPAEYNTKDLEPEVRKGWLDVLRFLQENGHTIHKISLPTTKLALSAYYIIAPAEASSNLARYDGIRYGNKTQAQEPSGDVLYAKTRGENLGAEVQRRVLLGAYSLSAKAMDNYFVRAQRIRRLVQQDFNRALALDHPLLDPSQHLGNSNGVDVIITPTATSLPPLLSTVQEEALSKRSATAYRNDVFTVPSSLAGLPSLSVPVCQDINKVCGIGIQVIGQFGDDDLVLDVGKEMEHFQSKGTGQKGPLALSPALRKPCS